jgi:hypothetical protein
MVLEAKILSILSESKKTQCTVANIIPPIQMEIAIWLRGINIYFNVFLQYSQTSVKSFLSVLGRVSPGCSSEVFLCLNATNILEIRRVNNMETYLSTNFTKIGREAEVR